MRMRQFDRRPGTGPIRHFYQLGFGGVAVGLLAVIAVMMAGCSSGTDATVYGGSFSFTSPGGKTEFSYPAGQRQQISALSGPDLSGPKTIDLTDYRGKVVVLNFWATWCASCRDEAAGLESTWQKFKSDHVQFVGVDIKDRQGDALAYTAGKGITYPSIYDPAMQTMLSLRGLPTTGLPVTLVVDKQGKVAQIWLGETTPGDLNTVLTPLSKE